MRERRSSDSIVLFAVIGCLLVPIALGVVGAAGAAVWFFSARAPAPPVASPPVVPPTPPPVRPPTIAPPSMPPPPIPSPPAQPRMVRATVTAVEGSIPIDVGAACGFSVDRRDRPDGTFWCNAQIVCGGRLLYGGPEAGYFPCTLHEQPRRDVVGADRQTHAEDRDAAMSLDTITGDLEIWDDDTGELGRYRVRARVDSVE